MENSPQAEEVHASRIPEIVKTYLPFTWSSFGGPQAHVAMMLQLFVLKLQWIPEHIFLELFAIAQSLPGPSSTQLAYSLAVVRGGPLAGIVAFLIWSVPCAIVMTGFAIGVANLNQLPSWALYLQNGLTSAALGLVALAAYNLGMKILNEPLLVMIGSLAASLAITITNFPWLYPIMMVAGGLTTLIQAKVESSTIRRRLVATESDRELNTDELPTASGSNSTDAIDESIMKYGFSYSSKWGYFAFSVWLVLLIASVFMRQLTDVRPANIFGTLYFVGSIIFGGGPVVIPLLQGYVVDQHWMTNTEFLIGLALINALPGPNFNFGVYCGALALRQLPVVGAILGYLGIFSPGIILMTSLLPLWRQYRQLEASKAIFKGVNAAAVGLVFAAVYLLGKKALVATNGSLGEVVSIVENPLYVSIATLTYSLCGFLKLPAPLGIIFGGLVGIIDWAAHK